MTALDLITNEDLAYAVSIRREIHRHPELGFDLPNTVSIVKRELTKIGVHCFEDYAPCSVCGYIGRGEKTLAIRADMDALPIEEKTRLSFASQIPGKMHACGHDAHTAILLAVARILKRNEEKLPVRVKLLFEPSEECEISGAKAMLDNGAMDDVDAVIATHCDNSLQCGQIGYCPGDYMAACDPITLTFFGKTAHATMPENGIDAIAMASEAISGMREIVAVQAKDKPHIFSVGYFHGGTAHNVIADECTVKISFRYYDLEMARAIRADCLACCEAVAAHFGGRFEADWRMSAPAVHNDEVLIAAFVESVQKIFPEDLVQLSARKSTEDFAWFLSQKPGFLFRFGSGNPEKGNCTAAHCNDFLLEENGMFSAIAAFVQCALDIYVQ